MVHHAKEAVMATQTRTQAMEDMTAVSEQFRKTAEAATEQARQTVNSAQEQFQRNLTQAQQLQSDVTQLVVRLNEQNGQFVATAVSSFWDASMALLNVATWGQEQIERGVHQLLEQGRQSREQGTAILRDAAEQARRNQDKLYHLAQESLRTGLEGVPRYGPAPRAEERPAR
jgi:polyhydroxyalkanoate synthesis regulator phasin